MDERRLVVLGGENVNSRAQGGGPWALEVADLSVTFGATRALRHVDLKVSEQSIHALLGGNGSGKSTLIKVLAGVAGANAEGSITGNITLMGKSYRAESMTPGAAHDAGLRFVHQDLGMFSDMTVAENFALYARYPCTPYGRVRWRALRARVADILDEFEIPAVPSMKVSQLRPAMRTMLAVARALQGDTDQGDRVLVLDEPTASLPRGEAEHLLRSLRQRSARGESIIFVSHRLQEVLSLADEITVLRDGEAVKTLEAAGTTERDVIELMSGRAVEHFHPMSADASRSASAVATVSGLRAGSARDISLSVQSGEIVGLAGLLGAGCTSILRALFGDLAVAAGSVRVGRHTGPFRSPRDAMRAGAGYVPGERATDAAFLDLTISMNVSVTVVGKYFRRLWLRQREERRESREIFRDFMVRAHSVESGLGSLSGGNQQKVILARWLRRNPAIILLDEPTHGVDVVARAEIYRYIRRAADRGAGVLVASSDLEELATICDRVLVVSGGRLSSEVHRDRLTADVLHQLIYSSGRWNDDK